MNKIENGDRWSGGETGLPEGGNPLTETFHSEEYSNPSSNKGTAYGHSLEGSIHHLAAVAGATSLKEVGHVISLGEWSIGNFFSEKFAQGGPAVTDLVLQ